ncbi:MAG: fibronectin type III domain-containing protein [Bacteroidetes bacterium]|nr:fibronectin type III domain-containing protein [Bacteroidota bacterium]
MSRVKIDFDKKPVPQQVAESRDKQTKITGNPNFVTPIPSLADIKAATDALENAYTDALNGDRAKKATMRITRKALKELIVKLADYVQIISDGDETKILSSGFGVRKQRTPATVPDVPIDVKVSSTEFDGALDISFKPVKGAKSYVFEICADPLAEKNFTPVEISTRSSIRVKDLAPGTKYWFRVLAVNAAGKSGWSVPQSGRTTQF